MKTDGEIQIMERINELITPIIRTQMLKELKKNGSLDEFVNKKIPNEGGFQCEFYCKVILK